MIVEDGAFIGSRCIVVEGVVVGEQAVLGANVVLTASTPIIDVTGPSRSRPAATCRPARSSSRARGRRSSPPARTTCRRRSIIGRRTESTDLKVSLNDALRSYGVAV